MTVNINPTGVKSILDQATGPGQIMDLLRQLGLGSLIRALHTYRYRLNPNALGTNPYNLATLHVVVLPDDAKAIAIARAYSRASGGTNGELTVDAPYTTPIDGHIAVTPSGDIAVLAASAYTDVDFDYRPAKQDVVELTLPVVPGTGFCTLPATQKDVVRGVLMLMEAEVMTGTATGKKIVLAPAAGAPAAGNARLNVAKSTVQFAVADAVTTARVKLGVVPVIDTDAVLETQSTVP